MQPTFTTRPEIRGTFGAVATTHWLATQTGMAVLERGGNAFDAAVAAGFVLQIVEPHLNGPGGELPAIVFRAGAQGPEVICGQGPFPASATPQRLTAMGLEQMPGTGLLPAVVPGAFDGWMLLLRDYGTLTLRDVLSYAIAYAERGFPLVPRIVATIIPAVDYFKTEWPSSGEVWLVNGQAAASGQAVPHARHRRDVQAHPRRSRSRGRRPRSPDRGCASGLLQGLRRRSDRPLLPQRADGLDRRAPSRATHRRRPRALRGARRKAGLGRLSRLHGEQDRAVVAGPDVPANAAAARRLRHRRDGPARSGIRPYAGRGAEARLRGPRHVLWRSRCGRGSARNTAVERVRGYAPQADRQECRDGRRAGRHRRREGALCARARDGRQGEAGRPRRRRADLCAAAARMGRHRASRCRGRGRQHDLGDAVRRLAARLAGGAGLGLSDLDARTNLLARGGACLDVAAEHATAHHAVADARHARRRAVSGDRHAGRRSAGTVDPHGVPAPRASPHGAAAGGRRADVPDQAHGGVVSPARVPARARSSWRTASRRRRAPNWRSADTWSPSRARGRSGASARSGAGADSSAPPRRRD